MYHLRSKNLDFRICLRHKQDYCVLACTHAHKHSRARVEALYRHVCVRVTARREVIAILSLMCMHPPCACAWRSLVCACACMSLSVCPRKCTGMGAGVYIEDGHQCKGRSLNYTGRNYIGRNDIGHNYIGHNYMAITI